MGLFDFLPSRQRIANLEGELAALKDAAIAQRSGTEVTYGSFEREFAAAMKGDKKWDTLDKMLADPHVKAGLDAAILPLLTAEWSIQPATDEPRDVEIADFCSANLLRTSSDDFGKEYWTATSWRQRLFEILDMLASGFSIHHKTWRIVGDKVVYDRLTWLEPRTVDSYDGWLIDEDTGLVTGITREYTTNRGRYVREKVPIEELVLYSWEIKGQRYDGHPLLRSLYGPWYRKDFMAKIAAINVQKIGSPIPIVQYPSNNTSEAAKYEDLAKMMRGQSPDHAYFAGPMGSDGEKAEIDWAAPPAAEVDRVGALIDRENLEMSHGVGRKSQMLGETDSGSRALGGTQMSSEVLRWRAIAEWVCEIETHGVGTMPGLIEDLVDRNYAGVNRYPRLTASHIDPQEQAAKLEALVKAKQAGLIPTHADVMRQVSAMVGIDLPEDVFDEEVERREQMLPPQATDDDDRDDAEDMAALAADDLRRRLSQLLVPIEEGAPKGGGFRYPTRFEQQFVALGRISERQRRADSEVAVIFRRIHRLAVDETVGRVASGKLIPRNIESQRRSKFRGGKALKTLRSEAVSTLTAIGRDGAAEAAVEIERQQGVELADPGDVKVAGGGILKRFLSAFGELIEMTVGLSIERIWSRVIQEGVDEYSRLVRQGLDPLEIETRLRGFLDDLSERPLADLGRQAANVAVNGGRGMTLRTAKQRGAVTHALRSEVLDTNTCEVCIALDGTIVEIGSAEYDEFEPPAKCLGGDRCRGFYVGISREMVEGLP